MTALKLHILILYQLKVRVKAKDFFINSATVLPSKNVKFIFLTIYDSICQFNIT